MIIASEGTQTAVLYQVHVVYTTTVSGAYEFLIDTSNMLLGDRLLVSVSTKIVAAGALVPTLHSYFSHAQLDPIKASIPIIAPYGMSVSISQQGGTARAFSWCVITV